MKLGNDPMPLLAHVVQRRDKICTTCAARRKQAQYHYDHLMFINSDCSDAVKKKYYQSLQEALREAPRDYQSPKPAFESGFFPPLSPELRDDFENVWRERTTERGWTVRDSSSYGI